MKKINLILACVGIFSTTIFATNDIRVSDQGGKTSKSQTIKNEKPMRKVAGVKALPQKDPKFDKKK